MGNIPLEHGLIVATILFALGFYGVMVRQGSTSAQEVSIPVIAAGSISLMRFKA